MFLGHEKIIADLKRLAASGGLSHGYIFFGPAMVGKKLAALHFANFLEIGDFSEDGILSDCMLISHDEKGMMGIDAVRELKNFLWQKPNKSKYRTAIVDDCGLLTTEAQNALLKISEEPPASSLLILIASDLDGLLPTISSRLQKIHFGTVPHAEIAKWLAVEHKILKKSAEEAAIGAFGKPGLALRLLKDQKFQALLKSADGLLRSGSAGRLDFIEKLLEDDSFDLGDFLDALTIRLASAGFNDRQKIARWHKTLGLRQNQANFNLNPKLQLENLFIEQ